jgi:hypothetical protein
MSVTIEATMLFKIKAVRRDFRKFSGPTRFLILLNLNESLVTNSQSLGDDCSLSPDGCYVAADGDGSTLLLLDLKTHRRSVT